MSPESFPPPEGLPPAPVQLTIGIVGLFGPLSFVPNPLQAAIGNTIIWTNNDVFQHDIVLDDGTPIGSLGWPSTSTGRIATANARPVLFALARSIQL
jgi:plastocyanin